MRIITRKAVARAHCAEGVRLWDKHVKSKSCRLDTLFRKALKLKGQDKTTALYYLSEHWSKATKEDLRNGMLQLSGRTKSPSILRELVHLMADSRCGLYDLRAELAALAAKAGEHKLLIDTFAPPDPDWGV